MLLTLTPVLYQSVAINVVVVVAVTIIEGMAVICSLLRWRHWFLLVCLLVPASHILEQSLKTKDKNSSLQMRGC